MNQHKWTKQDDLVAYTCYKLGLDNKSIRIVASEFGLPSDSLVMRVGNVKSLVVGGGLSNVGSSTVRVVSIFESLIKQSSLYGEVKS